METEMGPEDVKTKTKYKPRRDVQSRGEFEAADRETIDRALGRKPKEGQAHGRRSQNKR